MYMMFIANLMKGFENNLRYKLVDGILYKSIERVFVDCRLSGRCYRDCCSLVAVIPLHSSLFICLVGLFTLTFENVAAEACVGEHKVRNCSTP